MTKGINFFPFVLQVLISRFAPNGIKTDCKQTNNILVRMIFNTIWSWIILTTSLHFADDIVLSQDVSEVKRCPRECHCSSSNMMIYCGHEEGFNQLTEFPSFIPLKVKTLSLFNNRLTSIPKGALRNLTHLTNLNLGSNQLRDVPGTAFRDLVSLRSVNARLNRLSTLPRHLFSGLIRLQEVFLDDNEIVSIPDTLFQDLPSLRRLDLQKNKLKSFPETGFRGTFALQVFSLANNALEHISEGTFANLTSLTHLILSNNKISNIPGKVFNGSRSLDKLRLDNNEISFLPEMVFSGLKRSIDVSLSGNPLHCNCELRWLKKWLASRITYIHSRATCFRPAHLKEKPIADVEIEQFICVEGRWGDWSPWNACSRSCGRGTQVSVRRCLNPSGERGMENCQGMNIRYKRCNISECRASWTSWSQWSSCSTTCAFGKELRTRSCRHSKSGTGRCIGASLENRICHQGPCIIDGLWASWTKWSPCSVTCSWGTRVRVRSCDNPKPQNGGRPCPGNKKEAKYCYLGSCPVNGGWSIWTAWSSCTASCFNGTKMRSRKCNNPSPQNGGNWCDGVSTHAERCNTEPCPLDGSWSDWSGWGECSVTCSKGIQVRLRTCSHPLPQYGGKNCSGDSSDIKHCELRSCPLDGIWSSWTQWTSCSKTCSNGTRTRNRTCSNPPPQYGGKICSGNSSDIKYCNLRSCPLDGIWSSWTQWTSCSKTCSNGTRTRNRTCGNPPPQYGGKTCSGNSSDIKYCNLRSCPLDGIWALWTQWTSCSKTCSNGTRTRNRTCTNPPPQFGGKNCSGETSEIEGCHRRICPIHGQWTAWSRWSDCSHTCSGGIKYRDRTCSNPPPSNEGKTCTGNSTEVEMCSVRPCVVIKAWTEWSSWSDCSQTCSNATASRFRICRAIPATQSPGNGCLGDYVEIRHCHLQPCPLRGGWTEWSPWTSCSTKCSNETRKRSRRCVSSGSAENYPYCKGHAREERSCESDENCILSAWSNWSECSNTCGNGTRMRLRTCQNVVSPSGNEPRCTENKIEVISCGKGECPTAWSSWTACSTTCDFGEQTRTRSCGSQRSNSSKACPEGDIEMRACFKGPCAEEKGWNEWSRWTQCSVTCGYGKQMRYRNCSENGDAASCKGAPMQITSCFLHECPVNGGWNNWSNWTACSASCDKGVQARFRSCTNPRPESGGDECIGKNVLYKECTIAECENQGQNNPFWSSWTQWSKCSATCYTGYQTRSRYCRKRSSAFHLGNCTNSDGPIQVQNKICEVNACTFRATWTRWSAWQPCSQTCGSGLRKRVRYCISLAVAINCTGENLQVENCNTQLCPSVPTATYPPKITLGVPHPCPDPEKPVNGGYRIIDQDGSYYVQHYCKEHFFVHGPRLRHCERDNSWSDYVAYCLPVCGESSFTSDDEQRRRLRIYGGANSLPGRWPWQVVLEMNNKFQCGGSLVAESWVVTAAHCVYNRGTKIPYPYVRVYLGVHDITSRHTDPQIQRIDSAEIVPHPNFSWKTYDSDIALIKLAWKANITDYVRPVCLPSKRQRRKTIPGAVGVMLGWGMTEISNLATKLREVYMPVVGHSNCQKAYKRQTWPVTSNMLCAGYKDNAKDSCRQDSGGGFLFPYSNRRTKKWFLGGIISWGNPQCGTPGKYSVFTQINSKFAKWIKDHIYS